MKKISQNIINEVFYAKTRSQKQAKEIFNVTGAVILLLAMLSSGVSHAEMPEVAKGNVDSIQKELQKMVNQSRQGRCEHKKSFKFCRKKEENQNGQTPKKNKRIRRY